MPCANIKAMLVPIWVGGGIKKSRPLVGAKRVALPRDPGLGWGGGIVK